MTEFNIVDIPFTIKSEMSLPSHLVQFQLSYIPNSPIYLVVSTGFFDRTVEVPATKGALGVHFRNGAGDSIPDQRIPVYDTTSGDILFPQAIGTTQKAYKAKAPDGSIWYLEVSTTPPV